MISIATEPANLQYSKLPDMKLALIIPSSTKYQQQVYFAMFQTQQSGVNVKLFEERSEAVAWLKEE